MVAKISWQLCVDDTVAADSGSRDTDIGFRWPRERVSWKHIRIGRSGFGIVAGRGLADFCWPRVLPVQCSVYIRPRSETSTLALVHAGNCGRRGDVAHRFIWL